MHQSGSPGSALDFSSDHVKVKCQHSRTLRSGIRSVKIVFVGQRNVKGFFNVSGSTWTDKALHGAVRKKEIRKCLRTISIKR